MGKLKFKGVIRFGIPGVVVECWGRKAFYDFTTLRINGFETLDDFRNFRLQERIFRDMFPTVESRCHVTHRF